MGGKDVSYDVTIYPKNDFNLTDIGLIKIGEDGEPLAGVEFSYFNADTDQYIGALTTDDKGEITFEDVFAGSYYLQETKTAEKYSLNKQKIHFTISKIDDLFHYKEKAVVTWTHVTDFTENDRVDKESGRHLIDAVNFLKPTLKKDADGKQDQKVNRGEEFKFNLTLSTPGDVKTYKKLGAFDVLDERLEFTNNWEVTGTTKENLNFTFDAPTNRLEWSVKDFTQLTPRTPIKITFGAKVKKDVTSTDPITNIAKLTYDNNKGDFSKEGEEPESPNVTVTPKDGGLQVVKIDGKDQTRLQNAKFTVTTDLLGNDVVDATGTSIRLNNAEAGRLEDVATNEQGEFLITGLTPGTYYLHETVAPGDYRKLIIPVKVTVEDTQTATTEVKNYKSLFDLPATGGLGAILVITSAGALGYKGYKKSKKDEQ